MIVFLLEMDAKKLPVKLEVNLQNIMFQIKINFMKFYPVQVSSKISTTLV